MLLHQFEFLIDDLSVYLDVTVDYLQVFLYG